MNLKGFSDTSEVSGPKEFSHAEADKPGENREFLLFRRVQGAMRYAPDFVETCKSVLNAVMDGIDAENCSIMLKDPVSGELTVRAARGKSDGKTAITEILLPKGKNSNPGRGLRVGS